ncbi:MAG TPA: hypothetical protein VK539_31290 [Myxococcaceae bacterium]|nr:hypothetical protein [Myxococcaceae bacterium]
MNSFLRIPLTLAAAAVFGVGCGTTDEDTQPQVSLGDEEMISAEINALKGDAALQWWRVRKELNKYKDVNVALADGYIPVSPCEALPGQGGMGFHYLNPGLAQDLASDPFKPEILLYAPDDDGGVYLAGVEYFQAAVGQPAPSLVGQTFDGPMPGHNPQMPVHYDLHVWLYRYNNNGLFAAWNPRLKCPAAE